MVAVGYALGGFKVFPVHTVHDGACSCSKGALCESRGKHPWTEHGHKDATTDQKTLLEWWTRSPDANIGIATGAESGIVVVDVDPRNGGDETLRQIEAAHGALPKTPQSRTGSDGSHLLFRHPGGSVKSAAGALGPGVDVKGDGGYIVAPPSRHASGSSYRWVHDPAFTPLADLPKWVVAEMAAKADSVGTGNSVAGDGTSIATGQRNATLASLAGSMRKRGMTADEIEAAIRAVNGGRCQPPLADDEVQAIAQSVARYPAGAAATSAPVTVAPPITITVRTARELCALPDPPTTDHLLGPLVVRGHRLVLGGHTGQGKTTLSLQLVRAVVLGDDFLDWQGAGGRALFIDAEQGIRTIKRRLTEAYLDQCDKIDYLSVPEGLALDTDPHHVAEIERVLASGDYSVVVADPLYKLHAGDSNDERSAVDLMKQFDKWRADYGFAFILPVHCRKPVAKTKFTMHEFFGSSAYLRGAEVVVGVQVVNPGFSRLHFFKDRDGDLPFGERWGLLFDRATGYTRDPSDGQPKLTTEDKVAELLAQKPGITQKELMNATGRAERTIRKALSDIGADSQRDTSTGEKSWSLPQVPV